MIETLDEAHARARLAERRVAEHPTVKAAVAAVDGGRCGFCRMGRRDLCPWDCA